MNWLVTLISSLRRKPTLLMAGFILILGIAVLADAFAPRHGIHFVGDKIVGFWALFGLMGAIIMTKFMKWLAHSVLVKPLDFYDRFKDGEE